MMMMMSTPLPIESGIRSPPKSESSAPRYHQRPQNSCADVNRDDDGPSTSALKHTLKFLGFNLLTVFHYMRIDYKIYNLKWSAFGF